MSETTYRIQPADRADGLEPYRTQRPYPFYVDRDGFVGRQDFWQGNPFKLAGFQDRLDIQTIDLSWRDFRKDPQRAVGKYAVLVDREGKFATNVAAVMTVEVIL